MLILSVPRFTLVLTVVLCVATNSICAHCGLPPLVPTDAASMVNYGTGVTVEGDTLKEAKRQLAAGDSGTFYVFNRTETGWVYTQALRSPVGQYDRYGYSIASPLILAFRGWPIASGGGVSVTIDKRGSGRVTGPNDTGARLQSHFHMGLFRIFFSSGPVFRV